MGVNAMLRVITATTILCFLSGGVYAAGAALPVIEYAGKKVVEKSAMNATGLDGKIGTNNQIENPGSKEHTQHINELKANGQYKTEGNAISE